ncbi:hypothetical protein AVEN_142042-1 [Araneus ventricosus]|uniref:Uncharacterized protein n=1 Tax=Araneus ventricosus TaxID=182803 RepID=A0A4Y2WST6_ARAVE|nr:hypothetical protein AVEN_142042-1 [Araneus ventricosus]
MWDERLQTSHTGFGLEGKCKALDSKLRSSTFDEDEISFRSPAKRPCKIDVNLSKDLETGKSIPSLVVYIGKQNFFRDS